MTEIRVLKTNLSDLLQDQVSQSLLEAGSLVLRTQVASLADFLQFSNQIGSHFISQGQESGQYRTVAASGTRQLIENRSDLFSITGYQQRHALPFHGEFFFQDLVPPQLLWFYCRKPSTHGGYTLVCDGEQLFQKLARTDQALFSEQTLIYERWHTRDTWQRLFQLQSEALLEAHLNETGKTCQFHSDGSVTTHFPSPAIRFREGQPVFINSFLPFALRQTLRPEESKARIRFEDGTPITRELVLRVEQAAQALTRAIEWQTGDIALIDNTRMMHGRAELDPHESREVCVRMSDADFLAGRLAPWPPVAV